MENTQDLFLELLRSGLWGTSPTPAHFVHADWDAVFKLADIQTVGTIVLDGVALLPKDVHPPLGIKMRRIGAMQQVERTNALHRKALAAIHATLAKEGIREVYMKGQMAGMRYPNPLHRQPGDIDFAVARQDFPRTLQALSSIGKVDFGMVHEHHGMARINGVTVEPHYKVHNFQRPSTDRAMQEMFGAIFEKLPESQVRGYTAGRFSFNVSGGRCEACKGAGVRTIEMNFLPDVYVHCEACGGKRYNKETWEVRYKGKSIGDVLNLTINQAVEFFENMPQLHAKLKVMQDVGLGYIQVGQPCTTLSGGESQRIKLAAELSKKDTGRTLYILDEPTTGLHFEDINILLDVLQRLVNKGNTVIVIEHNLDVIKVADYLIDMGPGGGKLGGQVVCVGTPEEVALNRQSETAPFLREELGIVLPD